MSNEEQDRYILRKSAEFDDYDPRDYDENVFYKCERNDSVGQVKVEKTRKIAESKRWSSSTSL